MYNFDNKTRTSISTPSVRHVYSQQFLPPVKNTWPTIYLRIYIRRHINFLLKLIQQTRQVIFYVLYLNMSTNNNNNMLNNDTNNKND